VVAAKHWIYSTLELIIAFIVGNIPFDCTEEQLIDVFKEVGPVESFRYVELITAEISPLHEY
jgi:hypothetical protein